MPSTIVWYIESYNKGTLLSIAKEFDNLPYFKESEILASLEQAGLMLLVSRWSGKIPSLDLPSGTKQWSFIVL